MKGVAATIPNENILISSLTLQEARDSSSIENIITTQNDLYKADLAIRDNDGNNAQQWEDWIVFILKGIEETAIDTISMVKGISALMTEYKLILKPIFGSTYKHELLNNLFFHPYTKIEFICNDMSVQRKTGAKYLDKIVSTGLLEKIKIGRENFYVNKRLFDLFLNHSVEPMNNTTEMVITE